MVNAVLGIIGRRGSGKTLLAVAYLYDFYKNKGKKIYSNIRLGFPYTPLTEEDIATLPPEMHGSVVLIDEIQAWYHAYNFLSKGARNLSTLLSQLRKRDITLIYTTQFYNYATKPTRQQTDYVITMESIAGMPKGVAKATIFDPKEFAGYDIIQEFQFDGRPYFNLYDTTEVVISKI